MKKNRFMFMLSLVFAGMAAWLANAWVQKQTTPLKNRLAKNNTTEIVVAAVDIKYGQTLDAIHLRSVEWPNSSLPEGWIGDINDISGKIAKREIEAGEPISQSRVVAHLAGSKLSALIPKSKRAMTIRVDDVVGVAGFLLPGNRVDVYGVRKNRRTNKAYVKTVLIDVNVLAVDQDAKRNSDDPKVVRAVTLEVSPTQATLLVKAMHEGRIQLALRNPDDRPEQKVVVKKVRRVAAKGIKKPAPAKLEKDKVTIIRGTNVAKVEPKLVETEKK